MAIKSWKKKNEIYIPNGILLTILLTKGGFAYENVDEPRRYDSNLFHKQFRK